MSRRYTFRDNRGRAAFAAAILLLHGLLDAGWSVYFLAFAAGIDDLAVTIVPVVALLDAATGIVALVATIAFILWMRRAYENAASAGMRLTWSLGWSIGAWFVPFICLFVPVQMIAAMWRHALPGRSLALVAAWWTAWLGATVVRVVSVVVPTFGGDAAAESAATWIFCAGSALDAAGAVLALLVVRSLTAAQVPLDASVADVFGDGDGTGAVRDMASTGARRPRVLLVGAACAECGEPVARRDEGAPCAGCGTPLHHRCAFGSTCPVCTGRARAPA